MKYLDLGDYSVLMRQLREEMDVNIENKICL